MKRVVVYAAAIMALLLSAGTTTAAGSGPVVETVQMSFARLDSQTCSYLSPGQELRWSGTGTSITTTKTDRNGVTTISALTFASGIARDQALNPYSFQYTNLYRVSNTLANPGVFSGPMFDTFSLAGQGPIRLNSGFGAIFTNDAGTFHIAPFFSYGDPLKFADPFENRCDPM